MFLGQKTVLEILLNPWLNLTIFQGTGPDVIIFIMIGIKQRQA